VVSQVFYKPLNLFDRKVDSFKKLGMWTCPAFFEIKFYII